MCPPFLDLCPSRPARRRVTLTIAVAAGSLSDMALSSPGHRLMCQLVVLFALGTLLGHVCALEGGHAHPPHMASSASSADTHSGGSVAIHEGSCEGLKPTSTSSVLRLIGSRPLAVSYLVVAAPATAAGIVSAPVPRQALFVLHGAALLI